MVWGDGGAYATWFASAPEQIHGINLLPVTGGHFYLGNDPAYVKRNYAEMVANAGHEPALWQDIAWQYLALGDGDAALAKFRAGSGYTPEEGETKAHTFHWIRNLAALGTVDLAVTADHPLYRVFSRNGARTYVASNITDAALTVTFSDGTVLPVPAGRTVARGAANFSGGNATGGGINPTPTPTTTSSPTPTTSAPPTGEPAVRFLRSAGVLAETAGEAGTATIVAASGANDNQPHSPTTFTATGLNLAYRSGAATAFGLAVDSGTSVGNAVQVRVSYDLTGNGSADRVETFRYFATDPVAGWERYADAAGRVTATGALGDLANGTVTVEIWSAIGAGASTVSLGALSTVTLPYARP
jgi:hypothetical protein